MDQAAISFGMIGVAAEGGAALLLAGFFYLLRRYAVERGYFLKWATGWVLVAVALSGVVLHYEASGAGSAGLLLGATSVIYQFGKLLAFCLFLIGVIEYVRPNSDRRIGWSLLLAAGVYTAISAFLATGLPGMMQWQGPAIVLMSLAAGFLLFLAPDSRRRTLGSRMSGALFLIISMVWGAYLFALVTDSGSTLLGGVPWMLLRYDGWVDLVLNMLLSFAMMLVLLDDVERERAAAQAELHAAHARLREESFRDSLTQALNRRALNAGVKLKREGGGAVVVCDLDNLKQVNDAHGHKSGDDLLKYFVKVVKPNLRRHDKLYRFGGDEFVLVLPGAQAGEAVARMEALLSNAPPMHLAQSAGLLYLSVSVGGAEYLDSSKLDDAVAKADNAMYGRKRERKPAFRGRELSSAAEGY